MATYPDISDYTDSVQNHSSQVIDPKLRNAKPRLRAGKPEMMSGGVAVVYPFQDGIELYAIKCWLRDIGDLRERYRRIEKFLNSIVSKYFVNFSYVGKGIIARDQIHPILRMKWVGGKNLLEFVSSNASNKGTLLNIAERYLEMSSHLHSHLIAHGDLQGSNIKVIGSGSSIDFQLIDYDTLIIPSTHGQQADALALPSYQHPKRGDASYYFGKEDYFSELVIYISLVAIAENPSLWSKYPKGGPGLKDADRHDKDMLFVKEDFVARKPTEIFMELFCLSPLIKGLAVILWNFTRMHSIEHLIPIEQALIIARGYSGQLPIRKGSSAFEDLLITATIENSRWLDDSAFHDHFGTKPIKRTSSTDRHSEKASGTFSELLKSNIAKDEVTKVMPPQVIDNPILSVCMVKRKGKNYRMTIRKEILTFKSMASREEFVFDPTVSSLQLRSPWWNASDNHVVFKDRVFGKDVAFTLPLLGGVYKELKDWWYRKVNPGP